LAGRVAENDLFLGYFGKQALEFPAPRLVSRYSLGQIHHRLPRLDIRGNDPALAQDLFVYRLCRNMLHGERGTLRLACAFSSRGRGVSKQVAQGRTVADTFY
jgi:hypothetical protein